MELLDNDAVINASTMDPIPAGNGEATIWDSTKCPFGQFNHALDPKTGLYVATGTYLDSVTQFKAIILALTPTTQPVTFKLYWWVGAAFVLVNGAGKSVTAGTTLAEVVPLGGRATKITYLAGATPPSAMVISARLRRDGYQPVVTTV